MYFKTIKWRNYSVLSFTGFVLHIPDALPHLLHHLLLGHGRGHAQVDGVGLPLLTRYTRRLKSLNE